jgi:hypothetical protein
MKLDFILNENVIRSALNCSNPANKLLLEIFKNHHSIVVEASLCASYWQSLRNKKSSLHHPFIQPLIGAILYDSSRCKYLAGPFEDPLKIYIPHRNDVFLVQLGIAMNKEAFIVTSDRKTREYLAGKGYKAITLKEALVQAMQD